LPHCPQSVAEITEWARANGIWVDWARHRFVQLAVLDCVAGDSVLSEILVLRGAAALVLYYRGSRPTRDLDFFVLNASSESQGSSNLETVKQHLNILLTQRMRDYFDGQPRWESWLAELRIDLAPCPYMCDCTVAGIKAQNANSRLKVCTLEMLIAQKLVAVLTPDSTGRWRWHDVFDIAYVISNIRELNRNVVAELAQSTARHNRCLFGPEAFTPDLRQRLAAGYESLKQLTAGDFIPFITAWDQVCDFVARLPR
jgi:hypothetical protein